MRIDKLLSNLKYGSRKDIKQLVRSGSVTVNGTVIKKESNKIDPINDEIKLNGMAIFYDPSIVLMMHKPSGYECSHHSLHHKTVFELLDDKFQRLEVEPIGRLDQDTTGLLLFTNDGQFLHDIISPNKKVYKRYLVTVDKPFLNADILTSDYTLEDKRKRAYQPNEVRLEVVDSQTFYVDIHEGKYHQIKEMFRHFGYTVTSLKRTQIGDLILDDSLALGAVKILTKKERRLLV